MAICYISFPTMLVNYNPGRTRGATSHDHTLPLPLCQLGQCMSSFVRLSPGMDDLAFLEQSASCLDFRLSLPIWPTCSHRFSALSQAPGSLSQFQLAGSSIPARAVLLPGMQGPQLPLVTKHLRGTSTTL
jgi:hypothetical protein